MSERLPECWRFVRISSAVLFVAPEDGKLLMNVAWQLPSCVGGDVGVEIWPIPDEAPKERVRP